MNQQVARLLLFAFPCLSLFGLLGISRYASQSNVVGQGPIVSKSVSEPKPEPLSGSKPGDSNQAAVTFESVSPVVAKKRNPLDFAPTLQRLPSSDAVGDNTTLTLDRNRETTSLVELPSDNDETADLMTAPVDDGSGTRPQETALAVEVESPKELVQPVFDALQSSELAGSFQDGPAFEIAPPAGEVASPQGSSAALVVNPPQDPVDLIPQDALETATDVNPLVVAQDTAALTPAAQDPAAQGPYSLELPQDASEQTRDVGEPEAEFAWDTDVPAAARQDQPYAWEQEAIKSEADVSQQAESTKSTPWLPEENDAAMTTEKSKAPTLEAPTLESDGTSYEPTLDPTRSDGVWDGPNAAAKPSWSPIDLRGVELRPSQREFAQQDGNLSSASLEGRRQAKEAVRLGFELAQRNAPFSARSRFVEALQIIARSLDDAQGTTTHSHSLKVAFDAYDEADDFFPSSARPDQPVDLSFVAGGHTTPILRDAAVGRMTAAQCVREYLAFAEQEFVKALGDEELGSRALYGLGRLDLSPNSTTATATDVRAYRAMALYQAAMSVHSGNFAAGNELGVLLAKYGQPEAAIAALSQSAANAPHPTVWQNLAELHRKMGNVELAREATQRARRMATRGRPMPYAVANPKVEWVQPERFGPSGPIAPVGPGDPQVPVAQKVAQQVEAPSAAKPANDAPIRSARRIWPFGRN